jgi:hypothetical protein
MPSAFISFCNKHRRKMREEHPEASFGEMGKLFGEMWHTLTDKEKGQYQKTARRRKRSGRTRRNV